MHSVGAIIKGFNHISQMLATHTINLDTRFALFGIFILLIIHKTSSYHPPRMDSTITGGGGQGWTSDPAHEESRQRRRREVMGMAIWGDALFHLSGTVIWFLILWSFSKKEHWEERMKAALIGYFFGLSFEAVHHLLF